MKKGKCLVDCPFYHPVKTTKEIDITQQLRVEVNLQGDILRIYFSKYMLFHVPTVYVDKNKQPFEFRIENNKVVMIQEVAE